MPGKTRKDANPDQGKGWRDRVKAVLAGQYEYLAQAIAPEADASALNFELVSERESSLGLKVSVGDAAAFLKLFDGAAADVDTRFTREKQTLLLMRNSGLTVRLVAFSDPLRFLLTRYEPGVSNRGARMAPHSPSFAREIGEWTAHFDAFAPNQPAQGNWFTYLSKFGDELNQDVIKDTRDILVDIPLLGAVLARNDPSFGNYIVDGDGALVGCDFEAARMRPRGWDYLLTYQAVIENAGDGAPDALNALSDGFSHKHRGALLADELNALARILFCARAVKAGNGNRLERDPWQ